MNTHCTSRFYSFLVIMVFIISTVGCGKGGYPNSPVGVTSKLFDSLQENDANKYLDSITPEDRQQPGFFFYRQLIQGIFGGLGLGSVEAAKPKIAFTDLKITETSRKDEIAIVDVSGKLRDLNFALEQDFSAQVVVQSIDGQWLVDLSSKGITQTPSGEVQVIPTQEPCRGWKFHVIEVEQFESNGWIYYSAKLAVENVGSILAPSFQGMNARYTIGEFTLTTAEGYTYPASWVVESATAGMPSGIRLILGSVSTKAATGTTNHIVHTLCGPLDIDNPKTNFIFPTELPLSSFIKIGDPINLPEGILTITSAFVVSSGASDKLPDGCNGINNVICIQYTFINANKGNDATVRYTAYIIGDDGEPKFPNTVYSSFSLNAGPGQTVEKAARFPYSSTNKLILVLTNEDQQKGFVINLDKLATFSGNIEQPQISIVQPQATSTLSPSSPLYRVVHVASNDVLNIREGAGVKYKIVGTIPYNGRGVQITGGGVQADNATWVTIIYNGISGWVNSYYLTQH